MPDAMRFSRWSELPGKMISTRPIYRSDGTGFGT